MNFEDFWTEIVDNNCDEVTAQCEDCERQVHICQVDSHVHDSYWKPKSGQILFLEKYETRFGFQFWIESNNNIEEYDTVLDNFHYKTNKGNYFNYVITEQIVMIGSKIYNH